MDGFAGPMEDVEPEDRRVVDKAEDDLGGVGSYGYSRMGVAGTRETSQAEAIHWGGGKLTEARGSPSSQSPEGEGK